MGTDPHKITLRDDKIREMNHSGASNKLDLGGTLSFGRGNDLASSGCA